MKTKKRIFLFAFGVLFFVGAHTVNAQVTIGGEIEPVKGATLDLSPENGYVGGLKLPNVNLTSLTEIPASFTDKKTVTAANLKGLQVYNTNATIGEGVYTWNGSRWTMAGLNQNLVYNYYFDDVTAAAGVETNIMEFTLAPGVYQWSVSIPFSYTDTSLGRKACSFLLRNKVTTDKLAEVRNDGPAYNGIWVYGVYTFSIDAETTVTLSVISDKEGRTSCRSVHTHRFCQLVKLN